MKIENKKIGHPFKVPDAYFEKLEIEILSKTVDNQLIINKSKPINWKLWPIGIAASLILLVGTIWFGFENKISSTEKELSNISQSQAIAYLENENIDYEEIADNISIDSVNFGNIELDYLPITIESELKNGLEKGLLN